jgi:hypothetical protein
MKTLLSRRTKSPANRDASQRTDSGNVAFRYFFFGWLFRNACAADLWVSSAALAFNIRQRHHLRVYMGRWSVIFLISMVLGTRLDQLAANFAFLPYLVGVFALCYLLMALVSFLLLESASHSRGG